MRSREGLPPARAASRPSRLLRAGPQLARAGPSASSVCFLKPTTPHGHLHVRSYHRLLLGTGELKASEFSVGSKCDLWERKASEFSAGSHVTVGSLNQLGSQAEPQEPGLQLAFRTALGDSADLAERLGNVAHATSSWSFTRAPLGRNRHIADVRAPNTEVSED